MVCFLSGRPAASWHILSLVRLTRIPRHITVNLHGFFFLDSERLRIDGLENGFRPNGATSSTSCLEWNRIVATQGTLRCLPRSIADFAERERLNSDQCRELADAILGTLGRGHLGTLRFTTQQCHYQPDSKGVPTQGSPGASQKAYFSPNCISRMVRAEVICRTSTRSSSRC